MKQSRVSSGRPHGPIRPRSLFGLRVAKTATGSFCCAVITLFFFFSHCVPVCVCVHTYIYTYMRAHHLFHPKRCPLSHMLHLNRRDQRRANASLWPSAPRLYSQVGAQLVALPISNSSVGLFSCLQASREARGRLGKSTSRRSGCTCQSQAGTQAARLSSRDASR